MTKPDPADLDQQLSDGAVLLRRGLIGVGGGILLLFLASVMTGFSYAAISDGNFGLVVIAILAPMLLAFAGVAYVMWRFWPGGSGEPVAQSTRKAKLILYAMVGLGAVVGVLFGAFDDSSAMSMFSNGPLGGLPAALAILVWVIVGPVLTWVWWRTVDEHEAATYANSGLFTAHAYIIIVPAWWLATRAGWLPPQDPMIVWLTLALLWSAIWMYRRYF